MTLDVATVIDGFVYKGFIVDTLANGNVRITNANTGVEFDIHPRLFGDPLTHLALRHIVHAPEHVIDVLRVAGI